MSRTVVAVISVLVPDPDDPVQNREIPPGDQVELPDDEADRLLELGHVRPLDSGSDGGQVALEDLSVAELRKLATARDVDVPAKASKADLVAALTE